MNTVVLNNYGFYELAKKPSNEELKEYYAKKYYQENKSSYQSQYTAEELIYFRNKIEQKYSVIHRLLPTSSSRSLLDIGCGEGFTLKFFKEKNWDITGIDFSDFGCKQFNPDCLPNLFVGDIYEQLHSFTHSNKRFDVIWLDNVLEHVLDPLHLLRECKKLLQPDGLVIVEVPNDFSILQQHLMNKKHIGSEFWIAIPDHISYFNHKGLSTLAASAGLKNEFTMSDFPIDFNLVNPDTNYNKDKAKGKNTHHARVELDNLMHSISPEKTVNYYQALADLGLGRQIVMFLKHQSVEQEKTAVLVTSISRKTGLLKAVRKAADKLGNVSLIGGDLNKNAIGKYFVDEFWEMPALVDLTAEKVIDYCKKKHIRLIIPSRDGELEFWSSLKNKLAANGIAVMVSPEKAIHCCLDKLQFYKTLAELKFPAIPTVSDIHELKGITSYVVKERFGAGSLSIGLNLTKEQAIEHAKKLSNPVFQPYISGEELSVDIYVDKKNKTKGVIARKRELVVNGESQITTMVEHPVLEKLSAELVEKIQLTGHVILQVLIDDAQQFHIIECNSRFGGASTLSLHCGLDSFYWALLEANGTDISAYPFFKSKTTKTQVRFPEDLIISK